MSDYEPTPEEALTLRRAASIMTKCGEHTLARALNHAAEEAGAPDSCEGCDQPSTTTDAEGVPLCEKCMASLVENSEPPCPVCGGGLTTGQGFVTWNDGTRTHIGCDLTKI